MYFINKNRYATLVYGKREAYISATANHHNHLILTGINESSHLFWWMFFFFFREVYHSIPRCSPDDLQLDASSFPSCSMMMEAATLRAFPP